MNRLDSHLLYIQEDFSSIVKNTIEKLKRDPKDKNALDNVQSVSPEIVDQKARQQDPEYDKDYKDAQKRLGSNFNTKEGKVISSLYAITKSGQRFGLLKKEAIKSIDRLFGDPHKLASLSAQMFLQMWLIHIFLPNPISYIGMSVSIKFLYLSLLIGLVKWIVNMYKEGK